MGWLRLLLSCLLLFGVACTRSEISEAIPLDIPVGDQCAWPPPGRPDDCYNEPPCAYYDLILSLRRNDDGALILGARPAQANADFPSARFDIRSANEGGQHLYAALRAVSAHPEALQSPCVIINVDQDLPFGAVTELYRSLEKAGARHVTLMAVLTDDPYRRTRVRIAHMDRSEFRAIARAYAETHGMEFSNQDSDSWEWLMLRGRGVSIYTHDLMTEPGDWFDLDFEMTLSPAGMSPTEAMMDAEVANFLQSLGPSQGVELETEYSSKDG